MQKNLLLFCFLLGICSTSVAQNQYSMKDFGFLIGTWTMKTEMGRIIESWTKSKDSGMDGISFSISSIGDRTLLEKIRLHESEGSIYYTPTGFEPSNNSTVSFKLISSKGKTFIFENKNHDFPQLISYQLKSPKKIFAWIEGNVNGKFNRIEFPYTRERLK